MKYIFATKQFFSIMKFLLLFLILFIQCSLGAQEKIIYLHNGAAPGSENWNWTEGETTKNPMNSRMVYNVTRPALIRFDPDAGTANGTAVIIVPGGGLHVLMIDKFAILAKELVKKGVSVFILKYRLVQITSNDPWLETMANMKDSTLFQKKLATVSPFATTDVASAVRHVRQNAADYNIEKNKVGLIAFSAGSVLSLNAIYNSDDEAIPDFAAINSAVMRTVKKAPFKQKIPALFIAAAADDQQADVLNSIELYNDWLAAKQPVELHIYAKGGHMLDDPPANTWVVRFMEWMGSMGFIKKA